MREATTEEEVEGFTAQTAEPNRSRITPQRKQEILKGCAQRGRTAKCVQQKLIERKGKVDQVLRLRTRRRCLLLPLLLNIMPEALVSAIRKPKKRKAYRYGEKIVPLCE